MIKNKCFLREGSLVVPRCSLCGGRHVHGAGRNLKDPAIGHRGAHCPPGTPGAEQGYVLKLGEAGENV
jgi:hypothetical protein